ADADEPVLRLAADAAADFDIELAVRPERHARAGVHGAVAATMGQRAERLPVGTEGAAQAVTERQARVTFPRASELARDVGEVEIARQAEPARQIPGRGELEAGVVAVAAEAVGRHRER